MFRAGSGLPDVECDYDYDCVKTYGQQSSCAFPTSCPEELGLSCRECADLLNSPCLCECAESPLPAPEVPGALRPYLRPCESDAECAEFLGGGQKGLTRRCGMKLRLVDIHRAGLGVRLEVSGFS